MYALRPGLHYAVSNGRVAFLDVARDRYFCLPTGLEPAFLQSIGNEDDLDPAVARDLVAHHVLVQALPATEPYAPAHPLQPTSSLLEGSTPPAGCKGGSLGVLAVVARTCLREKVLPFSARLAHLKVGKSRAGSSPPASEIPPLEEAVHRFVRYRPLAPVERSCLRDSLALADYLVARGHLPELVIGVMMDPFAAHCWLQSGQMVLNDGVDRPASFSPILVV